MLDSGVVLAHMWGWFFWLQELYVRSDKHHYFYLDRDIFDMQRCVRAPARPPNVMKAKKTRIIIYDPGQALARCCI